MSDVANCPPPTMRVGETLHGFRIERITPVPEIRTTAYEAIHLPTGAQVLHLHRDDRENLYAITFRTPPQDSTGVAHILEHSVLAGSEKYPVRDAFMELMKGSMNTFLNAFTAPDFTTYPVASQVRVDFYNLASVYTDLVFRPLNRRETFMQEGHHLEVGDDGELRISGIVYNEMKGAYSTSEAVAESTTLQKLFPDTPYGVESGGHPDHIPDLTYEAFCEFHRRYYSPSNARIFFYGHLSTAEHLAFLAGQMAGFERLEVDSSVVFQPRWSEPRAVVDAFPIGSEDPAQKRAIVNVAWLTAPMADLEERLVLEVLEEALVGNAAAPLRKALIESGLGEDLSPTTGLQAWFKQLPFVVGLRGADVGVSPAVEKVALDTLEKVARAGLDDELLRAAFHQVEFKGLEISRDVYPFGVVLLMRALGTWLHGGDATAPLRFPTLIASIRSRWEADPGLFEDAIRRWLVDNPHRLRVEITPSRTLTQERESKLRGRLTVRKASMTPEEVEEVRRTANALREEQRARERPENLATLPQLRLSEIPREVESIATVDRQVDGVTVLEHDLFSNGIAYMDVAFDVSDVPEQLQPYLPMLGAAATGMGAAGLGYEALATRKALVTGGVSASPQAMDRLRGDGAHLHMVLHASSLKRNIGAMVDVVRNILVDGDLTDAARLKDVLSEERNRLRAAVAPQGYLFARRSAAASLSVGGFRAEQWHGAPQIRFLTDLARTYDEKAGELRARLEHLRELVFRRGRLIVNLTGDADCLEALRTPIAALIAALPAANGDTAEAVVPELAQGNPGFALPGEVCYVGRVLRVPRHDDPAAPALSVVAAHLRSGVIYKKLRVEGGAYGGFALYDPIMGHFSLLSYRDPNLEETLEVFDRCVDMFLEEELDPDTVRNSIIGTVGRLDRPMDPSEKGEVAMQRWLLGLTDAERQRLREGVLSMDAKMMHACAVEILKPAMRGAPQAVYAPRERIVNANGLVTPPFEIRALD